MALAPAVCWLVMGGRYQAALFLFFVAAGTDCADGLLARELDAASSLGKVMDPLADKILLLSVLYSLMMVGVVPPGVLWTVFGRDALLIVGSFFFYWRGIPVFSPCWPSKVSTFLQICLAAAGLWLLLEKPSRWGDVLLTTLSCGVVGTAIWSAVVYIRRTLVMGRSPCL